MDEKAKTRVMDKLQSMLGITQKLQRATMQAAATDFPDDAISLIEVAREGMDIVREISEQDTVTVKDVAQVIGMCAVIQEMLKTAMSGVDDEALDAIRIFDGNYDLSEN